MEFIVKFVFIGRGMRTKADCHVGTYLESIVGLVSAASVTRLGGHYMLERVSNLPRKLMGRGIVKQRSGLGFSEYCVEPPII